MYFYFLIFRWFSYGTNQITGKEDWLFKGEYWKKDWSKCPDIFWGWLQCPSLKRKKKVASFSEYSTWLSLWAHPQPQYWRWMSISDWERALDCRISSIVWLSRSEHFFILPLLAKKCHIYAKGMLSLEWNIAS